MSRSARNRIARNSRGIRPVGYVAPLDRPAVVPVTIVGPSAPGRTRRNRVNYAGSSTDGYRSEWARPQHYRDPVALDARWDRTVNS